MQEKSITTPEIVGEGKLTSKYVREHQQCKVTLLREDKNKNGKKNPETRIIGRKARKLRKKKSKLEKIQEVPEKTF
jgi:hypothetical protein